MPRNQRIGLALPIAMAGLLLQSCGPENQSEETGDFYRSIDNVSNPEAVLFAEDFDALNNDSQPAEWDNLLGYIYNTTNNIDQSSYALVDDSVAYSGDKSIHFKGSQTQLVRALPAGTDQLYMRAYVRLSSPMGGTNSYVQEHLMGIKATLDAQNEVRIGQIQGTLGASLAPSGNLTPTYENWASGKTLLADTWYCMESAVISNSDFDQLYYWVDGELVHSATSADDWNNSSIESHWTDGKFNYVMFGFHNLSSVASDVWMDDIVVSTQAIGCDGDTAPVDPIPPGDADLDNGQSSFANLCAGCHGADGQGSITIDNSKAVYGDENQALANFIHDNMPKNDPTLCTAECARDIAGYIRSWDSDTPNQTVDPDPVEGETLYSENCSGCHGDKGTGGVSIDASKSVYGDDNQALEDFIHDNMPRNNPSACTDDCAVHIAAYIKTWNQTTEPDADLGETLYSENCSSCHGDQGTGSVAIDAGKSVFGDGNQALADFIHDNMPINDPTGCTGDCAIHVAAYIETWPTSVEPPDGDKGNGETLYEDMCSGCHGDKGTGGVSIDATKSAYGDDNQTLADFIHDNMPRGNATSCVDDCAADIAAYIRSWEDDIVEPIQCEAVNYGPRMIRILTRNEFSHSIEDLTGVNLQEDLGQSTYDAMPADNMLNGYSNNILVSIDNGSLNSYQLIVDKVVDKLAETDFVDVIDCSDDADDSACANRFMETFLPKVFRRPLTTDEFDSYAELFTSTYSAGNVYEGLKLSLKTALTSPQFLYRDESGVSVQDLEDGSAGSGEYQQSGTIQTFIDSSDPKTLSIYSQYGTNASFTGDDLIVVTVRGVQSEANGLWPTLSIESGSTVIAQMEINHTYDKTYQFRVTEFTGTNWIAILNKSVGATDEYQGGHDLVLSQWEISEAELVTDPLPDVELDDDAYVLTSYQLASYLAFTFTGSTPDDELLAAAGEQRLVTDAQIAEQVERLLQTDRARHHFGDFAAQWLRTDRVLDMVKDTDLYPTFTTEVREAMAQEIRDVFNHVVLDEGEAFTSLYNGNFTFANQVLADFYGIGGVTGSDLQKVSGINSRAGLVTSGAFLTAHAHEQETAPILRAVYLRKRMMCHNVPAPPTGVALDGSDFDEAREQARIEWEKYLEENNGLATARKKYEFQTSGSLCLTCHEEMINPLGGGFEDFDAVGLPQVQDYNGLTIDASGAMYGITGIDDDDTFTFTGAKELAHSIAELDVTRQCFIDNTFRLAMGTGSELLDPAIEIELSDEELGYYQCEVQKLDEAMTGSGNSTIELLKALGTLDSVRYRKDVSR